MPLFSLPLSSGVRSSLSRKDSAGQPSRKRKRRRQSSDSPSDDHDELSSGNHNVLLAASTNPLSLAPDEIAQYRLAGLSLDELLPYQKGNFNWPHQGLPRDQSFFNPSSKSPSLGVKGKGKAVEDVGDHDGRSGGNYELLEPAKVIQPAKGHRLRIQHLSVLTAIVHRCLLEGDIQRATRAFSLLLRAEVSGKALDLKSTGYWSIGAELLVRSSQEGKTRKFHRVPNPELELGDEFGEEEQNLEMYPDGDHRQSTKTTWGSKAGLGLAKSYYETLIIQYPYKKHLHEYVSSLDFWPAMAACEIYGIQSEYFKELQRLSSNNTAGSSDFPSDDDSDQEDVFADAQEQFDTSGPRSPPDPDVRRRMRQHAKIDKMWTDKDNIRFEALSASESLSARVEETMSYPPFDKDVSMLRLRGMLELYIGDMSVPQMPDDLDQGEDDRDRRFLYHQRKSEHERGKDKKQQHRERARALLEKCENEGGEALARNVFSENEVDENDDLDHAQEHVDETHYGNEYDY